MSAPATKGERKPKIVAANEDGGDDWRACLRRNENGNPKSTLGNAVIILRNDRSYEGAFRFNEMAAVVENRGAPMADADVTEIRVALEKQYEVTFSETDLYRALELVSKDDAYHPVRLYLEALRWDGGARVELLLREVLHADVTPLHVAYVTKFLVGAVARAMRPGVKVDTVLILTGPQGAGKSTFFRTLGGPWFSDTDMDLGSKDAYLLLGNSWIVEWGELNTLNRASRERAKGFLSASEDVFRPPYGRAMVRLKRTAVIVGTTNETEILHDPTGSRRFWILPVADSVDVERLSGLRDQVWAEAVARYSSNESWWLSSQEDGEREKAAEDYEGEDVWTPSILEWALGKVEFTMAQLLECALEIKPGNQGKREEMRAADVLKKAGFERGKRRRVGGKLAYLWSRAVALRGVA